MVDIWWMLTALDERSTRCGYMLATEADRESRIAALDDEQLKDMYKDMYELGLLLDDPEVTKDFTSSPPDMDPRLARRFSGLGLKGLVQETRETQVLVDELAAACQRRGIVVHEDELIFHYAESE